MLNSQVIEQAEQCITLAQAKGIKIATAESCTGGLLGAYLTAIPGSSAVFDRGFITYSNDAKVIHLQVKKEDIQRYGAVSKQVAVAMASGTLQNSHADLSIGITGIAGPGGESLIKPAGLVYIGLAYNAAEEVKKCNFDGDRHAVRTQTVECAIAMILDCISCI